MMRIIVTLLAIAACNNSPASPSLGDPCASDTDCAHRCVTGPDFPGGFCTQTCTSDADCGPNGACVNRNNGICLFRCPQINCSFVGDNWRCDNRDAIGGGQVNVCIGPG